MLIMGPPTATYPNLKAAVAARPGIHSRFVNEMLPALWDEALRYGVDPVGVVAQAGKETGWGMFGGAARPEFFNTCGLKNRNSLFPGVDDGDMPLAHARFANWQVGARAHVQHLRGYTGHGLPSDEMIVSPRYVWVTGRTAVHFRDLGGYWAPAPDYGLSIEKIAGELLGSPPFPQPEPVPAPAPAPSPVPAGTIFGATVADLGEDPATKGARMQAHRTALDAPLLRFRVFYSPGQLLSWSDKDFGLLRPLERYSAVTSFKTWSEASFVRWMDGIPADQPEAWICYKHEPEDDAYKSGDAVAFIRNYLAVYAAMDRLRKLHRNGHRVKLVKILFWYREARYPRAGMTWPQFHGDQGFVDAVGWDCYSPSDWAQKGKYATAEELLGPVVAMSQSIGIPWCVPELGATAVRGFETRRAAAIKSYVEFCKEHRALWASWWCAAGTDTTKNYHLDADPLSVAAWKASV